MNKDLTTSPIDRQNILNNPYAVAEIEKAAGIRGVPFEGKSVALKSQVAAFFEVTMRTIENCVAAHGDELSRNGYEVVRGNRLKLLKECLRRHELGEMDFGEFRHTPQLSIFDFRAFLNLAMLLTGSERARLLRQAILDVTIDTMNRRAGGAIKYINQRDEEFLQSSFTRESYRKKFTDALKDYVNMGNFKYPVYTDKIYQSIFLEKAREYRQILNLIQSDKTRDTFYSEIIDLIAAFEVGLAHAIQQESRERDKKLEPCEVDRILKSLASQPLWEPLMEKARMKMASRDLAFRDALHHRLAPYITPLLVEDFERFLGEKSRELEKRLEEARDVIGRLKDH